MKRVQDEVGERGEAEAEAEESAWVWGFRRGGNGSCSDVGLQPHFLVLWCAFQFPPHFKIPPLKKICWLFEI